MTKNKKNELLQIRVDSNLKNEYINFCNKHGYSLSKRLRLIIEKELKNDKKND